MDFMLTTSGKPKNGMTPVNVASGGVCCTLNTRYDDMAQNDILSLKHFPKTVVLIEY